jgi:hypothetical protein
MIVSHRHRFIFLKTRKTAGTSVEVALSRYCGPEDVVTPVSPDDEAVRKGLGAGPRNYLRPIRDLRPRHIPGLLRGRWPVLYWNHMPAREVRDRVGSAVWDRYFKFAFERDPMERVLSYYHHRSKHEMSLGEFVDTQLHRCLNHPIYTLDGSLCVDMLGRFDHLPEDLKSVTERLGLPFDGRMPHLKGGFRRDRRPPEEAFTPTQRQKIRAFFGVEYELLARPRTVAGAAAGAA